MKFCVDCKHFQASRAYPNDPDYARCTIGGEINLVSGKRKTMYCQTMRSTGAPCGPDAKLFEASRTPDFRDGRNPKYDDDWGSPIAETAPDGRLLKDVHNG